MLLNPAIRLQVISNCSTSLYQEVDDFVSHAKDGFIIFSMGSIVRPHEMPEATRKAFINVFSRLKQRVLWKWPQPMSDAPPNVKLLKWIPQQDVLGLFKVCYNKHVKQAHSFQ